MSGAHRLGLIVSLIAAMLVTAVRAQDWQTTIDAGDYAQARTLLEAALRQDPGNSSLGYQLARVLGYAGLNDAALAEFDALLARYPDNSDYLLGRAQTLARLGRTMEALETSERAIAVAPDYEDIWRLRLQLAERAADTDLAERLRSDSAARFPGANWWRRAQAPVEYRRWITAEYGVETLSNDAPDWSRRSIRLDGQISGAIEYFGELVRSERFDRSDLGVQLGGAWQALPDWRLGANLAVTPNAEFEPARGLAIRAQRSWSDAYGTQFALRRREYTNASVSGIAITGDKYIADYRIAYRLDYSRLLGAGSSTGHALMASWYPNERQSLGISLGAGEEIEMIGIDRLLRTRIRSITLSGRRQLAARYSLNWWLGIHRQGDLYRRRYAGLSVRIGI